MFLLLVSLYVIAFIVVTRAFAIREGYWGPVTLFGITAFYYYLAVPLEMYIKGQEIHSVHPTAFFMSGETRITIALGALIAFFGFVAGHHASGLQGLIARIQPSPNERTPRSLIYLVVAILAVLILVYGRDLVTTLSYEEANELRYNDAFYSFMTRLLVLTGGLIVGVQAHRGKLLQGWGLVVPLAIVAWGFFTSDKNPLLITAMGIGVLWVGKRSASPFHLGLYCAGAIGVAVILPAFSMVRAGITPDWESVTSNFTLEHQDANGPMMSLSSAMSGQEEPLFGTSYLYAIVSWVPRSIWPGRPEDLAQVFAQDNLPDWYPGNGLGYSLLAEAYLNFGYVGIFLQYFATAFFLDRLWVTIYPLCRQCGSVAFWTASLSVLHFQLLVMMHRSSVSQVVQTCVREVLLFVIVLWLVDRGRNVRRAIPRTRKNTTCQPPPLNAGQQAA